MSSRSPGWSCLFGALLSLPALQASSSPLSEVRQQELQSILHQDCGSCHGMTLKGGLGPALTPDALHNKPRSYLQHTIREGHSGTPMPPWKSVLTADEIDYLVELLINPGRPS